MNQMQKLADCHCDEWQENVTNLLIDLIFSRGAGCSYSAAFVVRGSILSKRQSKINLLIRQGHDLEEQVYYICPTSDAIIFMVQTEEESHFIKQFSFPLADNCSKYDFRRGKPRQQCQYRVCITFAHKQKKVETVAEVEEIAVKLALRISSTQ
ncbi:hypothetical protein OUZ56_024706 [Daphnia magna]|uniref:Uncharacterized protein n=1 Tax=Daphnia magna TaxID=35525 RepID=A0ABQ9ZHR7_9CRUS|nr:hypothetical protein OUZ56_024706 [Daphnia magna]